MVKNTCLPPVDLLTSPRCRAEDLGLPMPDSPHAVSACLPLWTHNIGYEEDDPEIKDRMRAAYPRFCLHPSVQELCDRTFAQTKSTGLLFPSRKVAERAIEYVQWRCGSGAALVALDGQPIFGVRVDPSSLGTLREYWQHAGEIVSSRTAQQILSGQPVTYAWRQHHESIQRRVAQLQSTTPENVWLHPSGMAAIAAVWQAIPQLDPDLPTVQFGLPYVDTLKIQQRFPSTHCRFFPIGSLADITILQSELQTTPISAVFCEMPGNPLLHCPDLRALRQLADQYGFLLVVDDTLAACINLNVLHMADIVVTSLTKYFSGYGDVMAGSVTLNPRSARFAQLHSVLSDDAEQLLEDSDAKVLEENSRDVVKRISAINRNAAWIAQQLSRHPTVDRIWHPSLERNENYETLRRPNGGYGGLLSVLLKDPQRTTPHVFDALCVCKGPNLGTVFTLCCPYTILAHYHELEFAERCGVSRWLLRISIGTEPAAELWDRFEQALLSASDTV
ncbi:MAG: hypothetical protein A3H76_00960 [Candidatus Lloydbacteria bacterium RIFCSPLOWO2_02_FULL_54_12]|nr:MAG: hypothetical protein A3H76_00960 [Candidatus Lloydbacteria bacterium RIFCSPLOWO2_02_FULL_54_12]